MKKAFKISFFCAMLLFTSTAELGAQAVEQPSGKLSGVFFIDYYYNVLRDTGISALPNTVLKGAQDVNGFQVRRIYLTYDYKVNSKMSSKLRLESDEANFTSNLAGDKAIKFGMFVKDAYVKWNYFGRHDVYLGIQGTPGFEISERVWGNRYIEKTIMDVRGVCPSRDLGVSFRGNIDSAGVFKYWLMFANGNAGLPERDKYKRYYGHFEVTPIKNVSMTLFADYQSRKPFDDVFQPGDNKSADIFTAAFFAGYRKKDKFSAGFEMFYRNTENANLLTDKYADREGAGISVFATYHFNKKLNVFLRYDFLDPDLMKDSNHDRRDLIICGLAYKPADNLTISPNLFIESYEKINDRIVTNSITPRLTASWSF